MKNFLKSIWKSIILWAVDTSATWLFNYIDKNKDGQLSQEEIAITIYELNELIKKLKKIK